ncbi:heptaprenyl diphosphate synthase [Sporobacter termitidis DSM 10068]|uniref:Heptaprenyl diphosphate synthase n=1 Tax=Sporobacter termitidis DSM 10068 TaxID=1123282 RepID=A0A1M5Z052_9FIRM|nr:Gx transporter family protein [Sporobacter termitidis]SHI17652.1 heptaprenyl diphosphate synthase [Sporobacter termitidis DSM 10068]
MKKARRTDTYSLTLLSLLFALSIALTAVEYMIPPIPLLPPGVKLGLSNIVTMYCLFFLGKKSAFTIVVLKSGFVFLIRGFTSFALSLSGGVLSALVMLLLLAASNRRISYLVISIAGAITHNIGQLIAASFLLGTGMVMAYFPLLLVSGVIMGNVTGALLRLVMPAFHTMNKSLPESMKRQNRSDRNHNINKEVIKNEEEHSNP